jgi:hypothetical protein
MEDTTRTVYFTEPAKSASTMALDEVRRLHHAYRGPEHHLLGLLRHGDSLAARVLVAHGLDLETARAEVDRLIAQGVLPGTPSDGELRQEQELQARWLDAQNFPPETRAEVERLIAQGVIPGPDLGDAPLLASLGIDLQAVARRLQETFGDQAYWEATARVRTRPAEAATHRPMGVPPPLVCARFLMIARQEAVARDQEIGPEDILLGLLRDAEDPVETESDAPERRLRGQLGLPTRGPHGIRLLVEARGLSLETLRAAVLSELDRDR